MFESYRSATTRTKFSVVAFWGLLLLGFNVYVASPATLLSSPFNVGDWVINYQDGFVRRGLIGEILFQLAKATSLNIGYFVIGLEILLLVYVGLVVTYFALQSSSRWLPWVILSPVTFLYATYNVDGGYRKELLLLAALATVALATKMNARRALVVNLIGLILFVVTVFSWEPAAFTLPVVWILLSRCSIPAARKLQWSFLAVGLVGLISSAMYHGSSLQFQKICLSIQNLGHSGARLCGGALLELKVSPRQQLSTLASFYPKYLWYFAFLALALVPFVASGWLKKNVKSTVLVLASTSLLYLLGTDYGRWIHLQLACLSMLWLVSHDGPASEKAYSKPWERAALLVWILAWSVPYSYNPLIWQGFIVQAWHHLVGR